MTAVVAFSFLLEQCIRKLLDEKKKFQKFCRFFRHSCENAAHAQLNKKLRMVELLTTLIFSEMHVFIKKHSIEFHKIWQGNTSVSM